jgi:predicted porin
MLSATAAVTAGTVSNPLFHDDNSGRQVAGRVELRPVAGLVAGTSLAWGPFLSGSAARAATVPLPARVAPGNLADGQDKAFTQTAWGADLEYSRDHYILRVETIVSAWRLPAVRQPALPSSLDSLATYIEGRYKLRPRLYVAARLENLAFSDVTGTRTTLAWDAPVSRVEVGGGYSIQRNLLLKLAYQYNKRGAGKEIPEAHLPAVQLLFWF